MNGKALRSVFMSIVVGLQLASCIQVTGVSGPTVVAVNETFELRIDAVALSTPYGGSGIISVEMPQAFTVLGASNTANVPMATTTSPSVQPGLTVFTMQGSSSTATSGQVRLAIRAPAAPASGQVLTVRGIAYDPHGPFAYSTGTPFVHTLDVSGNVPRLFAAADNGLPRTANATFSGLCTGDFDGDGRDDLAALAAAAIPRPLRFDRTGTWREHSAGLLPGPGLGAVGDLAFGDFDGDGRHDLAVDDGAVWFGDGAGNWLAGPRLPLTGIPGSIDVGDVNGDGIDDIALATLQGDVRVFVGSGARTFVDRSGNLAPSTGGDTRQRLLLADLTGDGALDLVSLRVGTPNFWVGDGAGNWTPDVLPPAAAPQTVTAADFDGDGRLDLALADNTGAAGLWSRVSGAWILRTLIAAPTLTTRLEPLDLDRDGRLDLIVASATTIDVWRNGPTSWSRAIGSGLPPVTSQALRDLAVFDFDGDTFPDVVMLLPDGPYVLHNQGTGAAAFGVGCGAGGAPPPRLSANGPPRAGTSAFAFAGVALFWLGVDARFLLGQPVLPLDLAQFGAPGCRLLVDPRAVRVLVADPAGIATQPLPIPPNPALHLRTFFAQAAVASPGANALGLSFSNGLAVRID